MLPLPHVWGRVGMGDAAHCGQCVQPRSIAPHAAALPLPAAVSSLRSLSLRCLPPQGGKGMSWGKRCMDAFSDFINLYFLPGLAVGCIYALGAIGISLLFGILRFAHFAHGDMMTLGAYLAVIFTASLGWSPYAALPIAVDGRGGRGAGAGSRVLQAVPAIAGHRHGHRLVRRHADAALGDPADLGRRRADLRRGRHPAAQWSSAC